MNSKITALFAVAVMVTAGFVLVADTAGTDAKVVPNSGTAGTISIKEGVSHNVTLYTDEYQYSNYGYQLTWYIAKNINYTSQTDLDTIQFEIASKLGDRNFSNAYTSAGSVDIDNVLFTLTERKYTMKKEVIKSLIALKQKEIPFDIIERDIRLPINRKKIITIPGVRRCGKSSLM